MLVRRHLECALIRTTAAHEMHVLNFEQNYYEWAQAIATCLEKFNDTRKQLIQLSSVFFSSVGRRRRCDARDQHCHAMWLEDMQCGQKNYIRSNRQCLHLC